MDPAQLEVILRSFAAAPSRRGALRLLGGALLGGPGPLAAGGAAAPGKGKGKGKGKGAGGGGGCTPSCADKVCGGDGCGISCGGCAGNEMCQGGSCICLPDCTGKMCGGDGCRGGSCACSSAPSVTFPFLTQWGTSGSANGEFDTPLGVAVAPRGTVYVADTGNHRIQRFGASGTVLTTWGSAGVGNGQFNFPRGVAVHPSCAAYVADTGNHRVQTFRPVA